MLSSKVGSMYAGMQTSRNKDAFPDRWSQHSKDDFHNCLLHEPRMDRVDQRRGVPVAIFLHWLQTWQSKRGASLGFGLTKSSIGRHATKICAHNSMGNFTDDASFAFWRFNASKCDGRPIWRCCRSAMRRSTDSLIFTRSWGLDGSFFEIWRDPNPKIFWTWRSSKVPEGLFVVFWLDAGRFSFWSPPLTSWDFSETLRSRFVIFSVITDSSSPTSSSVMDWFCLCKISS